jgi:two-component system phosphate regulon response regulator PhoB
MTDTILVVDDEEDIRELVRYNLTKGGFNVVTAASGEEGLSLAQEIKPCLIVLDIMLPGIDGLEVCRRLKSNAATRTIPVVIISALGEEKDVVAGLELGADDYVSKPFSPGVLLARVKSVIRRVGTAPVDIGESLSIEGLKVNPTRREVHVSDELVELTNTEFKLLHFLMRQPGVVFTRTQIVDGVHGDDYPDVQVVGLRKKLGDIGALIETVRGVGYRFKG